MSGRVRILVVDDEERWQDDSKYNLQRWGWEPIIATGYGDQLRKDAVCKLKQYCCHIALVDMDLLDRQGQDHSGLELIQELSPATAIVVTAYPSRSAMRESLKKYGAFDFVGKDEGPQALQEMIEEAIKQHWRFVQEPKSDLFSWPNNVNAQSLTERFRHKLPGICADEVVSTLYKHYKDAIKVSIEHRDDANPSSSLTLAPRGRSAIFKITVTSRQEHYLVTRRPTLVKFARWERVQQELANYRAYVDGFVPARNVARPRKSTLLWHIGLIEYEFLNERGDAVSAMPTFAKYYIVTEPHAITKTLQRLFKVVWGERYRQTRPQEKTLFQTYNDVWKSNSNNDLESRLRTFQNKETEIRVLPFAFLLPNPIQWILRRVDSKAGKDSSPRAFYSRLAITHGDMHADNILVDRDGEPNLIDFERTGYGPILQDFVLLEVDVLLRMTYDIAIEEYLRLLLAILDLWKTEDQLLADTFSLQAQKAYALAATLRKLADQETGEAKEAYYLWGLLLNLVFRITLLEKQGEGQSKKSAEKKREEQKRAFLYGGLICWYLTEPSQWPPFAIQQYLEQPMREVEENGHFLSYNLTCLRNLIKRHFSLDDIQTLCADLQIEYDNLGGDTKEARIRELLLDMERQGTLADLIKYCEQKRPLAKWFKCRKNQSNINDRNWS